MLKLFIINFIIIAVATGILFLCKKLIKKDKQIRILFTVLPLLTIVCHYSSLIYHLIAEGSCKQFLVENPNLVLPIYPCNVVMWCLLILGICWNKENRFKRFLVDFTFYFGIVSALVGMFANVDFVNNPTLLNYDVTKGIIAHGFMLMNIMALGFYKVPKIDLHVNFINIVISIVMMAIVGAYCNLLFYVISGSDAAYQVNSMFMIHSPFDGVPFLIYPVIAGFFIPLYFGIFQLLELIFHKKGERWIHRPITF